jgi:hypothetical protein
MGENMLAGSGPRSHSVGGSADGPPAHLQGTNGATPQAAPNQPTVGPGPNMLAGAGTPPQGPPGAAAAPPQPIVPPTLPMLIDALHKVSYVNSTLRVLLNKPDLKTKDILNEVGEAVADGVMGPFDAAKELATLPAIDDSLALRQWVGQHYATSAQHMQTIAEMIEAHGHMVRRGGQPRGVMPQAQTGAPSGAPQNAFASSSPTRLQ